MAYPRIIDFNKISEALVLVRGTLIELSIGGSLSLEGGGSPPQTLGSLEAITTFPKLQRFTADRVMLNGSFYPPMLKPFSEILPKSLISLTITEILYIDGLMLMDTDLIEPLRIWLPTGKSAHRTLRVSRYWWRGLTMSGVLNYSLSSRKSPKELGFLLSSVITMTSSVAGCQILLSIPLESRVRKYDISHTMANRRLYFGAGVLSAP
jgi:hypothetical protein